MNQKAEPLRGKPVAQEILENVRKEVEKLSWKPLFIDVIVGEDEVSHQYVRMKGKTAESVGMQFQEVDAPGDITTEDLISIIHKVTENKMCAGCIVQLPLPAHLDREAILASVPSHVDVDCLGKENLERFYAGDPLFKHPTARAVCALIDAVPVNKKDFSFLVIGKGELVGRPVSYLLEKEGYNVSVAGRSTANMKELLKNADVIVSATGVPGLVKGEDIKDGVIIIDAGTSESGGSIVGDIHESAYNHASYITPVPGGVGPVTVAMLCDNVLQSAKRKNSFS